MFQIRKYIRPLLRLKYGKRMSHMMGSCHCVKLSSLSFDGNIASSFKPNYQLINFLKSRKTLITEPGAGLLGCTRYLHDPIEINEPNSKLTLWKYICRETNQYSKIVSLYKHIVDDNIINHYKKYYIAPKYNLNFLLKWNKDPLYEVLKEIRNLYPQIFIQEKDISLTFIGQILYTYITHNGMDMNLIVSYLQENKKIYSLDKPTKNYRNDEVDSQYHLVIRKLAFTMLIRSLITRIPIMDITTEFFSPNWLNEDFGIETTSINNNNNRNHDWISWITRYHLETEDPLFVVGRDHLNGKYGLINLLRHRGWEVDITTDY